MYNYDNNRSRIFSEIGLDMLLKIRDHADNLLKNSGAVTCGKLIAATTGDTWLMLACIDYLVETKYLIEIPNTISNWAQHRIFISGFSYEARN